MACSSRTNLYFTFLVAFVTSFPCIQAQQPATPATEDAIRSHYTKYEFRHSDARDGGSTCSPPCLFRRT